MADSVEKIGGAAFSRTNLWHILYEGTMAQWEAVTKPDGWGWMPRPDMTVYCLGQCRAYGHTWVDATCTEGSHCSRCGEPGSTPARGHNEYSCTEPATCTEHGYTFHGCCRCDYT